jgi:hypothetical protein
MLARQVQESCGFPTEISMCIRKSSLSFLIPVSRISTLSRRSAVAVKHLLMPEVL